jgi:hypothetical protein
MISDQQIISELNQLPENLKQEVLHYISFLKMKPFFPPTTLRTRRFGSAQGKYKLSPDFDLPLDDFSEYM